MTEHALAFGMMALFLFFVALVLSGLEVGTCPECQHCRDLREREEARRKAMRHDLEARYRPNVPSRLELPKRHTTPPEQGERPTERSTRGEGR